MHYDKKIAFALGILLVGVVGALFFRRESAEVTPQLADAGALAERIRDKPIRPYELPQTRSAVVQARSSSSAKPPRKQRAGRSLPPDSFDGAFPQDLRITQRQSVPQDSRSSGKNGSSRLGPPEPLSPQDHRSGLRIARMPPPDRNAGWKPQKKTTTVSARKKSTGKTAAQTVSRRNEVAEEIRYRVQAGDTLWGLALHFLGSSRRYREIFEANRNLLRDPDDLRPGMVLRIPRHSRQTSKDGQQKSKDILQKSTQQVSAPRRGPSGRPPLLPTPLSRAENKTSLANDSQHPNGTHRRDAAKKGEQDRHDERDDRNGVSRPQNGSSEETDRTKRPDKSFFRPAKHAPFVPGQRTASSRQYVIRRGDTLERISLRFYGHRRAVAAILAANRDRIVHPQRLRPGTTIVLP